jgi:hypothetical protein
MMTTGSVVSIAVGLSLVPAVGSLIPGFVVLRAGPPSGYRLSGRESMLAIVPTTAVFYGVILVFDPGSAWGAADVTAILAAAVVLERIGRRRREASRCSSHPHFAVAE